MIVAIDGPAGAGKSTVAQRVAERLGFRLINTGALYRAVAFEAKANGVQLGDAAALADLARALDVEFVTTESGPRVLLGSIDRTDELRRAELGDAASIVSAHPEVRAALLTVQRGIGEAFDVVMEGRDIGTVVFPAADVKVFLSASIEERARRRALDYSAAGGARTCEDVRAEILERDRRDIEREAAPLRPADDAVKIDGTNETADEVCERIIALVEAAKTV